MDLVKLIFEVCEYTPDIEHADPLKGSVSRRCPDISVVKSITGYRPKVSLLEGVKESCKWYMEYYRNNEIDLKNVV